MSTYRKPNGEFYDAFEPDEPGDKPLPLRPSDIHEWNGAQWVWRRHGVRHATPRATDAYPPPTDTTIADLLALLHEGLAQIEFQRGLHVETQKRLDNTCAQLTRHLKETEGLPEVLNDLKAAGRVSNAIARYILPVLLAAALIGAAVWSALHGDWTPMKKLIGFT